MMCPAVNVESGVVESGVALRGVRASGGGYACSWLLNKPTSCAGRVMTPCASSALLHG
jgi:hypothetical protein